MILTDNEGVRIYKLPPLDMILTIIEKGSDQFLCLFEELDEEGKNKITQKFWDFMKNSKVPYLKK